MKHIFSILLLLFVLLFSSSCENATMSSASEFTDNEKLTEEEINNIDSVFESYMTGDTIQVENFLKHSTLAQRRELLTKPGIWNLLKYTEKENTFVKNILVALGLILFICIIPNFIQLFKQISRNQDNSYKNPLELLIRDISTTCYAPPRHLEMTDKLRPGVACACRGEYGGFLHWSRDLIEKILCLGLIITFLLFLVRAGSYIYYWYNGEGWRLVYLPIDINIALTIMGFALITDGFIQVSAMTDAPGISRTLDAVIVTLAGSLIMLLEAKPSSLAAISFSIGSGDGWLSIGLASAIAMLFLVRWLVKHDTWKSFVGDTNKSSQRREAD